MMGVAIGPSDDTPGNAAQTVNGNYGFATSKLNLYPPATPRTTRPRPRPRRCTRDLRRRPATRSRTCAAARLHRRRSTSRTTRSTASRCTRSPPRRTSTSSTATATCRRRTTRRPRRRRPDDPPGPPTADADAAVAAAVAAGRHHLALRRRRCTRCNVTDPAFLAGGGSPFEGQDRPSCADKLVTVRTGQTTAPNFNLFTDVPIPTHFWGLTLNDLGLTLDKRSVNYGEAQGLPYVPVGLYDWAGRLVDTDAHRLQRPVRGARAVDRHLQLPGAGRARARTCTASWATTRASPGT